MKFFKNKLTILLFFFFFLSSYSNNLHNIARLRACLYYDRANQNQNSDPIHARSVFHDLHARNIEKAEACYVSDQSIEPKYVEINSIQLTKVNFVNCAILSKSHARHFKDYSLESWKRHFKRNDFDVTSAENQKILFENYILYKYQSYLDFLQTLTSFDEKVERLQNWINDDLQLKAKLAKLEFPFAKVAQFSDEIQIRQLQRAAHYNEQLLKPDAEVEFVFSNPSEKVDAWKIGVQNKKDFFNKYYQARVIAYESTQKDSSKFYKSYNLSCESVLELQKFEISQSTVSNFCGSHLQHAIHNEIVDSINQAALLNNSYDTTEFTQIINFALLAHEFNTNNEVQLAANASYLSHAFYAFCKGARAAGLDAISAIGKAITNPLEFIKDFAHGIGNFAFEMTSKFADFVLNPKTDEQYKAEFEDFCQNTIEEFKNDPDKFCESLGYHIANFLLAKKCSNLKVRNGITNFLKTSQFGQQACKIIDLVSSKGLKNVRDGLAITLENKGIIESEQILNGFVQKEKFIPATIASAIEYKQARNSYVGQLLQNYEKYKKHSYYKIQYQKYKLPIQYIPAKDVIQPKILSNGDQLFLDKFGSIWKRDSKSSALTINASPTFRKQVGVFTKEANQQTKESLMFINSDKLREVFNAPKLHKDFLINSELDWSIVTKSGETRFEHVKKHSMNNLKKNQHGIFYGDPIFVTNKAWKYRGNIKPITDKGIDKYIIPFPNAGRNGGFASQNQNLNYITIVTLENSNKILSSYPSFGN